MYSYRIEQAIRAAAILHRDQLRKGAVPLPYITHLMAVALILLDYTEEEDVIVAALLHDTLEDTDYTVEELREDFGGAVVDIVLTVTEPQYDGDRRVPWRERKEVYAKQLRKGSEAAVLVAAADKIHNFRTIVEEYSADPARYFQDFGKPTEERLAAYQTIADIITDRLGEHGIVQEFTHVFTMYKEFLHDVEKA